MVRRVATPFVDHASMVPAQERATQVVNCDTYSFVGPKPLPTAFVLTIRYFAEPFDDSPASASKAVAP